MTELLEVDLTNGDSLMVEVAASTPDPITRGGRNAHTVTKAGKTLEEVLERLGPAMSGIISRLREAEWPNEVQVEFGITLSTDANIIIVRGSGEANFRLTLKWTQAAPQT